MKKYIIAFAALAFLTVGTAFTSVSAFSDRSGLAEPVENMFEIQSKHDDGLFSRLRKRMGSSYALNKISARLRLSKEQKAEIREIIEAEIPVVRPILKNALSVHQEMKVLGRDGVYYEAEVQRLAALQSENARLLIVEKEKVKAQIFAVLNERQRVEAEAIRDEIEAKIRERMSEETGATF